MLRIPGIFRRRDESEGLAQLATALEKLNTTTEHSFLAVGENLSSILQNLQEVIRQAGATADLYSGNEGEGASCALQEVLDHSSRSMAQVETERLNRILASALGISAPLGKVVGIVRTFRVLGTMIQIESARLSSAGAEFGTLAEEVNTLTVEVSAQIDNIVLAAEELCRRVREILNRILALQENQSAKLPLVMGAARGALASLGEQRERAAQTTRRLAQRFESSQRDLGEVVSNLQFHDITRQQVEHVIEALKPAGGAPPDRLGALAALQSAQLRHAGESFSRSVETIRTSLGAIGGEVSAMAAESQELLGDTTADHNSFLAGMEQNLGGILALLGECAEAGTALAEASTPLTATAAEMLRFSADIQSIGVRMQRVALNASIRAAHLGEQGAALETLAGAIQGLARDSVSRGEELGALLGSIEDDVKYLAANADHLRNAAKEAPRQLQRMRGSMEDLHAAEQVARNRMVEVAGRIQRLAAEVEESSAAFQARQDFPERVEAAAAALDEVVARAGAVRPSSDLHGLKRLYTMHSEREIHERIESGQAAAAPPVAASVPEAAPASGDDLGDNVELF